MKRVVISGIVILMVFASISMVSAAYACNPEDTILKMSALSNGNSHGAMWNVNDPAYTREICYNEIFGKNGGTITDSHSAGGNVVLYLSGTTNAHASTVPAAGYTAVTFKGIVCTAVPATDPETFGQEIISLSAQTNAHIGLPDYYNGVGNYKILCQISTTPQPNTHLECQNQQCVQVQGAGANLCATDTDCITPEPIEEPIIANPEHRQVYYAGVAMNFNIQNAQTGATYEWIVYGPNNAEEFRRAENTFPHTFSTAGQRTIELIKKVNGQIVQEDQIAILVLGGSGIFAFIDKPRHKQEIINEELWYRPSGDVEFSAEDSYVVKSESSASPCVTSVTCLAGYCPQNTKQSPVCAGTANTGNSITIENAPVTKGDSIWSSLVFRWTFDMEDGNVVVEQNGIVRGTVSYAYQDRGQRNINLLLKYNDQGNNIQQIFNRNFVVKTQCQDGLLFYPRNADGTLGAGISTRTSRSACAGADGKADTGNSQDDADNCCQVWLGEQCTSNGCQTRSSPDPEELNGCRQFDEENSCNDAHAIIAQQDPMWSSPQLNCGNIEGGSFRVDCFCKWVDNSELENNEYNCQLTRNQAPIINDGGTTPKVTYDCSYAYDVGECSADTNMRSVTKYGQHCVKSNGQICTSAEVAAQCPQIPDEIPCGSVIELPFFGVWQIIAVVAIIIIVYFAFSRNSNKIRK